MTTSELLRLIEADIELSGNGLRVTEFAGQRQISDKTVRRLLDFVSSTFDVVLEYDESTYRWHYRGSFRIFRGNLLGKHRKSR